MKHGGSGRVRQPDPLQLPIKCNMEAAIGFGNPISNSLAETDQVQTCKRALNENNHSLFYSVGDGVKVSSLRSWRHSFEK